MLYFKLRAEEGKVTITMLRFGLNNLLRTKFIA